MDKEKDWKPSESLGSRLGPPEKMTGTSGCLEGEH